MARRKLTLAKRLQAVGISQVGLSNRKVTGQMGVHHFVNDSLMQRLQVTRIVDERLRSDRPRKTTPRQDKLIAR